MTSAGSAAALKPLAPNQEEALGKPCRTKCGGTYVRREGPYGPYVKCDRCADKVYRPRGKAFGPGGAHGATAPEPELPLAPAKPKGPLEGVKVPSQWHELVEMVAPFLGVGVGPHRVACAGPPATGKSSWSAYVWPERVAERVALTEETCPEDLLGHYILKGQDTVFVEGPATRAWKQGSPLVLDEIDRTSSSVVSLLHALLDDVSIARITLPTGETITPQPGFVCIGTTNAPLEALHEALLDRFEIVLHCYSPAPGALTKMPKELRAAVVSYYKGVKGQPWSAPLSVRRGLAMTAIAELTGNWELACALVLGAAAKEVASVLASQRAGK